MVEKIPNGLLWNNSIKNSLTNSVINDAKAFKKLLSKWVMVKICNYE